MNALSASAVDGSGRAHLVNLRQQSLFQARWRVLWIAIMFALVAAAALMRIAYLGLADHGPVRTSLEEALLPPRGEITDRNGVPLARAFPAYALWFNPKAMGEGGSPLVKSPQEVGASLKLIFPEIDEIDVAERLASGKSGYLRRRVLPEDANKVQAIGELALEMPRENDRHYPQGQLAAHVLGYIDADGQGKIGMEQVLHERLADPVLRGDSVPLSLDIRVQGALEDELRRGMLAVNALGAAGVVLDVDTGEIVAMASLPDFDPNAVTQSDLMQSEEAAAQGKNAPVFNRVTNQVYELGSTFKPITFAAAIDAGIVRDLGTRWDATPAEVGRKTFTDSKDYGDTLNVAEAMMYSSNTVTVRIADQLGEERLRRTLTDLGMSERPYIELPARGHPIWQESRWGRLKTMNVGFGHGVSVTPLHLASAYAAMVNGGIWRPATLHKLAPQDVPRGRRVFKASTSAQMRQLLRMTALYGTGRFADAQGYRVGGKTGSAEKPTRGGYRQNALISTFASAFPMDRPRYVVVAMLDEPRGTVASSFQRTAGWTAAPIVGRLVPRIGPLLGVRPDNIRDVDLSDIDRLLPEKKG